MPAEPESKQGPWLMYTVIAGLLLPLLNAIRWGPVGSLAANHGTLDEIAETAYAPVTWVAANTPLKVLLCWYCLQFSEWRPTTLPSIGSIHDDLQYFPPGPEFKLTRQVQAMEEYKRRQQGILPAEEPPGVVAERNGASTEPGL